MLFWRQRCVRAALIFQSFIKEPPCFFSIKSIRFRNTEPTLNFQVPAVSSLHHAPGRNCCSSSCEMRLLCHSLCRMFCIEKKEIVLFRLSGRVAGRCAGLSFILVGTPWGCSGAYHSNFPVLLQELRVYLIL